MEETVRLVANAAFDRMLLRLYDELWSATEGGSYRRQDLYVDDSNRVIGQLVSRAIVGIELTEEVIRDQFEESSDGKGGQIESNLGR